MGFLMFNKLCFQSHTGGANSKTTKHEPLNCPSFLVGFTWQRLSFLKNQQPAKPDLFQNGIATQLQIDLLRRVQVVDGQWRDLHDVADVEQVQPLTLI